MGELPPPPRHLWRIRTGVPVAHHTASIYIWAQVGLDPDGAPDHLSFSASPLCSGLEFPAFSSSPFSASHSSSPIERASCVQLNECDPCNEINLIAVWWVLFLDRSIQTERNHVTGNNRNKANKTARRLVAYVSVKSTELKYNTITKKFFFQ